jgi:hypothetical protein
MIVRDFHNCCDRSADPVHTFRRASAARRMVEVGGMAALGLVPERHRGRSPDLLRDDLGGLEFGSHLARRPMILWKMARAALHVLGDQHVTVAAAPPPAVRPGPVLARAPSRRRDHATARRAGTGRWVAASPTPCAAVRCCSRPPSSVSHTGPAAARRTSVAEIPNRELSSIPDTAFSSVPSARWKPPTTSICHNSIGRARSHRR